MKRIFVGSLVRPCFSLSDHSKWVTTSQVPQLCTCDEVLFWLLDHRISPSFVHASKSLQKKKIVAQSQSTHFTTTTFSTFQVQNTSLFFVGPFYAFGAIPLKGIQLEKKWLPHPILQGNCSWLDQWMILKLLCFWSFNLKKITFIFSTFWCLLLHMLQQSESQQRRALPHRMLNLFLTPKSTVQQATRPSAPAFYCKSHHKPFCIFQKLLHPENSNARVLLTRTQQNMSWFRTRAHSELNISMSVLQNWCKLQRKGLTARSKNTRGALA